MMMGNWLNIRIVHNSNVYLHIGRQGINEKNEVAPALEPVPGLPGTLPPPPAYLHPFPPQVY